NNLVAMKMQEMKLEKKLFDYVSSDIIDSYEKLIQQRKECIDKYSKFYTLFLSDVEEIDIIENYKLMMKKQNNEIATWNKELNAIKEMKLAFDELDDADYEKEIRTYLEDRTPFVYGDAK
ncbi:hypothetical protein IKD48_03030, partial [bacterium]|nr:hypothetical protein [bacterium]